jgi:hypothetical protein
MNSFQKANMRREITRKHAAEKITKRNASFNQQLSLRFLGFFLQQLRRFSESDQQCNALLHSKQPY